MPRTVHTAVLLTSLLACLLLLVPACGDDDAGTKPTPDPSDTPSKWTHVVGAGGAVYYLTGPQQGRPPEGTFPPKTKVRVLSEHGSYVRVESETGQTAHVAAGSIELIQR